jgi:hypothetical protein
MLSTCDEKGNGMKCRVVGDRSQAGKRAIDDKGRLYFSVMEQEEMPEKARFDRRALN